MRRAEKRLSKMAISGTFEPTMSLYGAAAVGSTPSNNGTYVGLAQEQGLLPAPTQGQDSADYYNSLNPKQQSLYSDAAGYDAIDGNVAGQGTSAASTDPTGAESDIVNGLNPDGTAQGNGVNIPGVATGMGGGNGIGLSSGISGVINQLEAWLGDWFIRMAVIGLGLIFIFVGLSMLKTTQKAAASVAKVVAE
jgi:hypothetical protein